MGREEGKDGISKMNCICINCKNMRRFFICALIVTLFASPLDAQIDSLSSQQVSEQVVIVSLDSKSEGRLESIDDSAKPYSLKELIRFPKGLDSVNLSFWIAAIALFFAIFTYIAQWKTEKHTKNVPIKDQREKFRDLSRHEYRNLCCALAAAIKFFDSANGEEKNRLAYPSESNLKKLKVQPEDIVLSIDSDVAALIAEMRLLLRNYNIEIDVASQHLSRRSISDASLVRDFDNILFKPFFLIKSAYGLELALVNRNTSFFKRQRLTEEELLTRTVITIVAEHYKKITISLPRYIDEKDYTFLQLLGTVKDDLSLTSIDRRSAIKRSVKILFPNGKPNLFRIKDLDDETKSRIEYTYEYLNRVKDEHPDEYRLLNHYESFIEKLKGNKPVDFREFLPVALLLDAIVETINIGMVNYE